MISPRPTHHLPLAIFRLRAPVVALAFLCSSCALWDAASGPSDDTGDAADISDFDIGRADVAADADVEPADVLDGEDGATLGGPFDDCLRDASGFALNLAGLKPQYQPRVAFDGTAIWAVYTQQRSPAGDTEFDIIATRITCEDGELKRASYPLNQDVLTADVPSPSIDIAGTTVHVVWSNADDVVMNQGQVAYRRLHIDGSSLMDAETFVDFRLEGAALTHFGYPEIVALPGEEAIITAVAGFNTIVLQQVEGDGEIVEDAVEVNTDASALRTRPSIAAGATGPVWLAWLEPKALGSSQYRVGYASFERSNFEPTGQPATVDTLSIRRGGPRFARGIFNEEHVFFVEQSNTYRTRLYNATRHGTSTEFGAEDTTNSNPSVTSMGARGAVAWFSREDASSLGRQVNIQSFHDSQNRIDMGAHKTIATVDGPAVPQLPGRPEIVWVGGDTYFVAVQDGPTASSTEVRGYLVQLD